MPARGDQEVTISKVPGRCRGDSPFANGIYRSTALHTDFYTSLQSREEVSKLELGPQWLRISQQW